MYSTGAGEDKWMIMQVSDFCGLSLNGLDTVPCWRDELTTKTLWHSTVFAMKKKNMSQSPWLSVQSQKYTTSTVLFTVRVGTHEFAKEIRPHCCKPSFDDRLCPSYVATMLGENTAIYKHSLGWIKCRRANGKTSSFLNHNSSGRESDMGWETAPAAHRYSNR